MSFMRPGTLRAALRVALVSCLVVATAACGGEPAEETIVNTNADNVGSVPTGDSEPPPPTGSDVPTVPSTGEDGAFSADLNIAVSDGADKSVAAQLVCPAVSPEHRGPCAALEQDPDVFAPIPDDVMCTEIYGGPETATITGTINGVEVDARLERTNGCEIDRWEKAQAVVGFAVALLENPPDIIPPDQPR